MTVREFEGADGAMWQVWAVHPPAPERRAGGDRRRDPAPDPWHERRWAERRARDIGRPSALAGPLAEGWLCFETVIDDGEPVRRRLTPIPPDWGHCDAAALRAYLARSSPARRAIVAPPSSDPD